MEVLGNLFYKMNSKIELTEDLVLDKNFYSKFESEVTCPIGLHLLVEPCACQKCETLFCTKCAEDWKSKSPLCINQCDPFNIVKPSRHSLNVLDKLELLCPNGCRNVFLPKYISHIRDCKKSFCFNCKKEGQPSEFASSEEDIKALKQNNDDFIKQKEDYKSQIKLLKIHNAKEKNEVSILLEKEEKLQKDHQLSKNYVNRLQKEVGNYKEILAANEGQMKEKEKLFNEEQAQNEKSLFKLSEEIKQLKKETVEVKLQEKNLKDNEGQMKEKEKLFNEEQAQNEKSLFKLSEEIKQLKKEKDEVKLREKNLKNNEKFLQEELKNEKELNANTTNQLQQLKFKIDEYEKQAKSSNAYGSLSSKNLSNNVSKVEYKNTLGFIVDIDNNFQCSAILVGENSILSLAEIFYLESEEGIQEIQNEYKFISISGSEESKIIKKNISIKYKSGYTADNYAISTIDKNLGSKYGFVNVDNNLTIVSENVEELIFCGFCMHRYTRVEKKDFNKFFNSKVGAVIKDGPKILLKDLTIVQEYNGLFFLKIDTKGAFVVGIQRYNYNNKDGLALNSNRVSNIKKWIG